MMGGNLVELGKTLYERRLVLSTGGNISCSVPLHIQGNAEPQIYITRSGSHLGFLKVVEDIGKVTLDGTIPAYRSDFKPSAETPMHCEIHKKWGTPCVVIHAHPPYTTMYFSENSKNSANLVPYNHETKWLLPKIQILEDYGETIRSMAFLHALKEQPLIVIPFHGVVSVGSTMEECLSQLELLESLAQFRLLKGE